jgi:hypothetical protein
MCINSHKELNKDNYRSELISSINATHDRLVNAVSLFNARKAIEPIDREMLKKFPFFEWIDFNPKVKGLRRGDRFPEKYLCFDIEMLEGGELGERFHSDLIESTEVVSGEMYDTYDQRYYRDGDIAHYDKGQKHTPIATKKTILHILFKP